MTAPIAFDVYGTLINIKQIVQHLTPYVGERAEAFAAEWRRTQIEYAIRRAAMKRYEDFSVCARQALDYTSRVFRADLSADDRQRLLETQQNMPAFPDVVGGLDGLARKGHRLWAFSNGPEAALTPLLDRAGILPHLDGIVSVDEVRSFKPDPEVYHHLARRLDRPIGETWLVSSNPWDVIGAKSAGLNAAWIQRDPQEVFDPWEIEPDLIADSLDALVGRLD